MKLHSVYTLRIDIGSLLALIHLLSSSFCRSETFSISYNVFQFIFLISYNPVNMALHSIITIFTGINYYSHVFFSMKTSAGRQVYPINPDSNRDKQYKIEFIIITRFILATYAVNVPASFWAGHNGCSG